jgi:hypothetical protein
LSQLTTERIVGNIANMPAQLITGFKNANPDGSILELVVWRVPKPVPPSTHVYKYRAVYIVNGERIVGFDNERGKGDHCHSDGVESPYNFTTVEQLVEDFIAAVDARRSS